MRNSLTYHSPELSVGNNIIFQGGDSIGSYAQLGNGGLFSAGEFGGAITITQVNDITFQGGAGDFSYVQLGQGGIGAVGDYSGLISLNSSGDLTLIGTDNTLRFALIGHGDQPGDGDVGRTVMGDVTVRVGGDATLNNAWIGHLLDAGGTSNSGAMSLIADGNISLSNNINRGSYDSASTYSYIAGGDVTFNSSVQNRNATGGDINIVAGWDGATAFDAAAFATEDVIVTTVFGQSNGSVVIGNGGQVAGVAVGSRMGNTNVFGYDVSLQGGTGSAVDGRFAQLGFQVSDQGAAYGVDGAIVVHATNDVVASGGDSNSQRNYAQIGHVGSDAVGDSVVEANTGAVIEMSVANDVTFSAGTGFSAYAQLGHGGHNSDGDYGGSITITRANDVTFSAGSGTFAYAQLGNGGTLAKGNHSGTVTITQANDVAFSAGSGTFAYAQLGHGGTLARGNHSGAITITQANDVAFSAGTGGVAYAQLGHGGYEADGSHSGDISLTHSGNLTLTGIVDSLSTPRRYALIGHGENTGDSGGDAGDTVSGDVMIETGGNVTLSNAGIGHQIDPTGSYASGNTFLGVGSDLTADANSAFNSAAAGVGELRLYVAGNDNVDAAAKLNGTPHGAAAFPNDQGAYVFGAGSYAPAVGNFAYYKLLLSVVTVPSIPMPPSAPILPDDPEQDAEYPIFVTIDGQLNFNRGVLEPSSPYVLVGAYAQEFTDDYFNWDSQRFNLEFFDAGDKRGWRKAGGRWTSSFEVSFPRTKDEEGWSSFDLFGEEGE
ncbi:MAG: hypothetical protein L3J39_17815 [Verrucomicrobiales bacterium]|nr:hypothetical protein [Verrucomicrobiales bacterium]